MRAAALVFLAGALFAPGARAHCPLIQPTQVRLKADGEVLRVRVQVTALAWRLEVAGTTDEAWPAEDLARSLDYFRKNLAFSVDGAPLAGKILRVRYVHDPWMSDGTARFEFDLAYPLPAGGKVLGVRGRIFAENWDECEGAESSAEPFPGRDFNTLLRWSLRPGAAAVLTRTAPEAPPLSFSALRRPAWERWTESAALGLSVFWETGGAVALALSAFFFFPSGNLLRAGSAAAEIAFIAGAAAPFPVGGRALWCGVVLLGMASAVRRPGPWWAAGLAWGALAAARAAVLAGGAARAATAFEHFSPLSFWAGFLASPAAAVLLRGTFARFHRKYFRHLTDQEYGRLSLFHRQVVSRFLAIAGLYWTLSPFWAAAR